MDTAARIRKLYARMWRERNGATAAAMTFYGKSFGRSLGVDIATLRAIAREEGVDHDFAAELYRQDVRELRLAALHIADPARLSLFELPFWTSGIVNVQVAGEAAFALLSRTAILPRIFRLWIADSNPLLQYAALLAVARSSCLSRDLIAPTLTALHHADSADAPQSASSASETEPPLLPACLVGQGAVAMFVALAATNEENRQAVLRAAGSLGKLPSEDYVREELGWRLNIA